MYDHRTFNRQFILRLIDVISIYLDSSEILLCCNWGGGEIGFRPPPPKPISTQKQYFNSNLTSNLESTSEMKTWDENYKEMKFLTHIGLILARNLQCQKC